MSPADPQPRIAALLRPDPLQHVVTLKMRHLLGDAVESRLTEGPDGWALLSLLPADAFEYDRATYPGRRVALLDGSGAAAKRALLEGLPRGPLVVKTADGAAIAHLVATRAATPVRSFLSYTAAAAPPPAPAGLREGSVPPPDVAGMFAANGYQESELARCFADGARWFGAERDGRIRAAGFVFRNFENVWEIGGIHTEPDYRRQGLARQVVAGALRHLAANGCIPRYQVRADNAPSVALAGACGLRLFLRLDHLLVGAES
jgi:ribosomal protein S18 acetylase RimI-like enzyme